jgi:hypothetical protein
LIGVTYPRAETDYSRFWPILGTPAHVIEKLNTSINEFLRSAEVEATIVNSCLKQLRQYHRLRCCDVRAARDQAASYSAREIGVGLELVAAAPAIVGGSQCNLTPLLCLPGKGAPGHGRSWRLQRSLMLRPSSSLLVR